MSCFYSDCFKIEIALKNSDGNILMDQWCFEIFIEKKNLLLEMTYLLYSLGLHVILSPDDFYINIISYHSCTRPTFSSACCTAVC